MTGFTAEVKPQISVQLWISPITERTGSIQRIPPSQVHAVELDETYVFHVTEPAEDHRSPIGLGPLLHAKSTLSERVQNILASLVRKGSISMFGEVVKSNVEVYTRHCANEMQTWLRFDCTGDILLVRIKHLFAFIEVMDGRDAKSLLRVLAANRESYKNSSFYLSIKKYNRCLWVYLECVHPYLYKWDDEDIAETISAQFVELDRVLLSAPPSPIRMFEQS